MRLSDIFHLGSKKVAIIEKSGVIDPGNPEESDPCNPAKLTHSWIC